MKFSIILDLQESFERERGQVSIYQPSQCQDKAHSLNTSFPRIWHIMSNDITNDITTLTTLMFSSATKALQRNLITLNLSLNTPMSQRADLYCLVQDSINHGSLLLSPCPLSISLYMCHVLPVCLFMDARSFQTHVCEGGTTEQQTAEPHQYSSYSGHISVTGLPSYVSSSVCQTHKVRLLGQNKS